MRTFVEKILNAPAGSIVIRRPDIVMSHDNSARIRKIFEEMGGTYRQVGDYLLPNITVQTKETECIGLWGQRHARHLKEYHKVLYMNLLTSGKLYRYLVDVDRQAGDMFLRLVKEYADRQGVTEQLKAENPHEWIGRMNNIQACVREVVGKELIYI